MGVIGPNGAGKTTLFTMLTCYEAPGAGTLKVGETVVMGDVDQNCTLAPQNTIATHILAFDGNSEVVWFEGNYGAYIEDLKKRKGPDAVQLHRVQYKKLVQV